MSTKMKFTRYEQGQGLVEFAFVATILLVLLVGLLDLGRALFTYMAMRDAAQEGATYGSIYPGENTSIESRTRDTSKHPVDLTNTSLVDVQVRLLGPACAGSGIEVYVDKYIDVKVQISDTVKTSFAQMLFSGKFRNQVVAITRVRPRSPLAYGHAVVALNDADCSGNSNGAQFGGSSDVDINGGGVWTNGCLGGDGHSYDVDVTNGSIIYAGEAQGTMNFNPPQTQVPNPLPSSSFEVPAPDCSDDEAHHMTNLTLHNGTLNLGPGLYCISGNMTINGGTLTGEGVTFYLPTGDVSISGNAEVSLGSPANTPDPAPAIGGILFYVVEGDIELEGNATSEYLGVVYAPQGTIDVQGANGTTPTFNTQLIGMNVHVSGNADIDINFNAAEQYARPTSIELWK